MDSETSSLSNWTPEQVQQGRRWVQAWREAGREMERLRREELRAWTAIKPSPCCAARPTTMFRRGRRAHFRAGGTAAAVQKGGRP